MTLQRVLVCAGIFALSLALHAQDRDAFYPLHEGDVRSYKITQDVQGQADVFLGTIEWVVGPDTTVDGTTYARVEVASRNGDEELVFQESCLTRYVPDQQRVDWLGPANACSQWGNGVSLSPTPVDARVPVEADTLDRRVIVSSQPPATYTYVEDLGLARVELSIAGGKENYDLTYARIGVFEVGSRGFFTVWREFDPRGVGDEWIYRYNDSQRPPQDYYDRELVLSNQVVGGVLVVQLQREEFSGTGILYSTEVVDLYSDSLKACFALSSGQCYRPRPDLRQPRQSSSVSVIIGGINYVLDTWSESWGANMSFSRSYSKSRHIGFVRSSSYNYGSGGGTTFAYSLVYASVGGRAYGVRPSTLPVAVDAPPSASDLRVVRAGANPSVQTSLEVTAASPFTVTVYDALGRRLSVSEHVTVGTSRVDIDLRRWSAGIYTAVVRTTSGEQATIRLVRP